MFVIQLIQLLLVVQLGLLLAFQTRPSLPADQRAPFSSAENSAYAPPSREQQLWALGTCAVLADSNGQRHDLLGGCERTPAEIKRWQDCLAKWWGVRSRAELLETLRWLDEDGHRREFNDLARVLPQASATQLDALQKRCSADSTFSNRVELVRTYQKELGAKGIAAWDYGRYVSLCGWGYVVGFLTEEEAWRKIMPVASFLQDTFESWDDLGRSYVIGREFLSPASGEDARNAYERLLVNNPASPWTRLPWDLDLTTTRREMGKDYDFVTSANFVETAGRPLPALMPTAQWTWKLAHANDAEAWLTLTVTGPNIPPANVQLPLKHQATQPGAVWSAQDIVLLDTAPWDSVCKGGHRTVTFNGVSTNGVIICVNRTWGPGSLVLMKRVYVDVYALRSYGTTRRVEQHAAASSTVSFRVPYTSDSRERICDICVSAKWSSTAAGTPFAVEP